MSILVGATSGLAGAAGAAGGGSDLGDTIQQSLRFTHGSNLTRNLQTGFGSFSSTATLSFWIKFDNRLTDHTSFAIWRGDNIGATGGDRALTITREGGIKVSATGNTSPTESDARLRDPAAWYHFMIIADSSSVKFYANGSNIFTNSSGWSAGTNSFSDLMKFSTIDEVNNTIEYYLAEVNFLDGTKATVGTDFGRTNTDGVWVPVAPSFTAAQYGTNGFRMQFDDSSNLGDDSAPIGASGHTTARDFTASGFDTAALSASNEDNDIDYFDTPTSNYGILNPLQGTSDNPIEANLSTPSLSSVTTADHYPVMEVSQNFLVEMFDQTPTAGIGNPGVLKLVTPDGTQEHTVIPSLYTPNQIGYAIDITNRATYVYDITNGAWLNGSTGTTNANVNSGNTQAQVTWTTGQLPAADRYLIKVTGNQGSVNTSANRYNFGQRAYLMDEPSGFVAVQTNNLPEPTIKNGKDHFDVALYDGTGSAQSITGLEFQPDFVWIKKRSNEVESHRLTDVVRGTTKTLLSDHNGAEVTSSDRLTAFNSDGFSVGTDVSVNQSGRTYVAWCWKAGGTAVSNTDGDITSSVSANTDAGFSIVKYTGSTGDDSVGHGLTQAPEVVLVKSLDDATRWVTFHEPLGSGSFLSLNNTDAKTDSSNFWGSGMTSTTFGVSSAGSTNNNNNGSETIAYCWHSVEGFSKFGSYTGNGNSDGPFIYTGFKVGWLMWKASSRTGNWQIYDSTRSPNNPNGQWLEANENAQEQSGNSTYNLDLLSNGFKFRGNATFMNENGQTYIYMAFAENPFGGENAPPATAR